MGKTLAAFLLGTAVIFSGCEFTPEQSRAILTDLGIFTTKQAIKGKINPDGTNINIHNQTQGQIRASEKDKYGIINSDLPDTFAYLKWQDSNQDKLMTKDELIGLGNYFKFERDKTRLDIYLASSWGNSKGKSVILEVKFGGKILGIKEFPPIPKKNWVLFANFYYARNPKEKYREGIAKYTAHWYLEGKQVRNHCFFVEHDKK